MSELNPDLSFVNFSYYLPVYTVQITTGGKKSQKNLTKWKYTQTPTPRPTLPAQSREEIWKPSLIIKTQNVIISGSVQITSL